MKNKKIKKFEKLMISDIESSKIYGGWDGVVQTGPGDIGGTFKYESDLFFDNDNDGEWDAGESTLYYHTTITPSRG